MIIKEAIGRLCQSRTCGESVRTPSKVGTARKLHFVDSHRETGGVLNPAPAYYNRDPKRDPNFDNYPCKV